MNPKDSITELLSCFIQNIQTGRPRVIFRTIRIRTLLKLKGIPLATQAHIHLLIGILQRSCVCGAIAGARCVSKLENGRHGLVTIKGFFHANLAAYTYSQKSKAQYLQYNSHCDVSRYRPRVANKFIDENHMNKIVTGSCVYPAVLKNFSFDA